MGAGTLDVTVTVVIIDDHPVVIEGVKAWLAPEPRVRVVATGDNIDALGLDDPHRADVLLLDLNLHGRLVFDDVARLAARGHRVIVYSQFTDQDVVHSAFSAGAREFVAKDEGPAHLINAVLAVAADEPYVTPAVAGVIVSDQRPDRPKLSERERTALLLWFQSMSKASVAQRMNISPHTVDMFIRRARLKYAQAGRPAHTKADLLVRAIEDDLVRPDQITTGPECSAEWG
ncbi:MAG: response regulator transcription factor [Pseudonocardiaceae bacterium]